MPTTTAQVKETLDLWAQNRKVLEDAIEDLERAEARMLSARTSTWGAAPPGKSYVPDRIGHDLEVLERKRQRVRRLRAAEDPSIAAAITRVLDRHKRYDYHGEAEALRLLYVQGMTVGETACRMYNITPTSPRYEQACRAVRHKRDHAFALLAAADPPELRTGGNRERTESEVRAN